MRLKIELPIKASALFEIDLPEEWDDWETEEKAQFILDYAETEFFLCDDCSEKIVTDFENLQDMDTYDTVVSKLEDMDFETF